MSRGPGQQFRREDQQNARRWRREPQRHLEVVAACHIAGCPDANRKPVRAPKSSRSSARMLRLSAARQSRLRHGLLLLQTRLRRAGPSPPSRLKTLPRPKRSAATGCNKMMRRAAMTVVPANRNPAGSARPAPEFPQSPTGRAATSPVAARWALACEMNTWTAIAAPAANNQRAGRCRHLCRLSRERPIPSNAADHPAIRIEIEHAGIRRQRNTPKCNGL